MGDLVGISHFGWPVALILGAFLLIQGWKLNGAKAHRVEASARRIDAETFEQLAGVGARTLVDQIATINSLLNTERDERKAERRELEAKLELKNDRISKLEDEVALLKRELAAEKRQVAQMQRGLDSLEGDGK